MASKSKSTPKTAAPKGGKSTLDQIKEWYYCSLLVCFTGVLVCYSGYAYLQESL
jgi:hypothetical protein